MNLSVGLITYNEEKNLARTLKAIEDIAGEIVIVDNGSTDKTVDIARSFGASVFVEPWKGFGMQKNSVIDKCRGKWILLIDADEEVTSELKEHIRNITENQITQHEVYKIRFQSVCFGKEIKRGGWSGFYRIRLFLNGAGRYDDRQVHEIFITSSSIWIIRKNITHYTYDNLEEYFEKFNRYTSEMAKQYHGKAKKKSVVSIYLDAKINFFKSYILQLGFLDGYEGYLLSKAGAMYTLVKYSKLRELNK
jgi:glycosyltransferase involved in cell wall biosynthesis